MTQCKCQRGKVQNMREHIGGALVRLRGEELLSGGGEGLAEL